MKKTIKYILVLLTMMLTTQAWAQTNVAKIGDQEFETLAAAIEAADPGATIEVIADVTELQNGSELSIDKSLTITGATNADGTPKYTVYGKSNAASTEYNDIFIKGSGTVTLSNLNIRQF